MKILWVNFDVDNPLTLLLSKAELSTMMNGLTRHSDIRSLLHRVEWKNQARRMQIVEVGKRENGVLHMGPGSLNIEDNMNVDTLSKKVRV